MPIMLATYSTNKIIVLKRYVNERRRRKNINTRTQTNSLKSRVSKFPGTPNFLGDNFLSETRLEQLEKVDCRSPSVVLGFNHEAQSASAYQMSAKSDNAWLSCWPVLGAPMSQQFSELSGWSYITFGQYRSIISALGVLLFLYFSDMFHIRIFV